jgi:type I restriction enzyme S subunit
MSELPEGWEWSSVGEVTSVQLGRQRSPKNHNGPHMRPYLRSANVTWKGIDVTDVNQMNFDPDEAKTFELVDGDILLNEASGSPREVGKPAIWRGEIPGACFQNTLLRVRSLGPDHKYLFWFFFASAYSGRFGEAGRGVNIRHLGKQGLTSFPIPVPPVSEQRRIVAAIEEHFSRLDAAESSLRASAARCEQLLAALRADAFGRNWPRKAVRSVAETTLGKMLSAKSKTGVGTTPYLRNKNVRWGSVDVGDVAEMDFSDAERDKFRLIPGDVLICEGGAGVGRTAIWRGEMELCCFQKALHRVRTGDEVLPEFVAHYFRYFSESRLLEQQLSGVAIGHFPQEDLRSLEIPVPPLEVQRRFIDDFSHQESLAEALERSLEVISARSNSLRRSILAGAFSGHLVRQDPSDEPASVLLERIAEQATLKPSRKKKAAS